MATLEEIIKASEGIRDATEVGENTATRVGGVFCDISELLQRISLVVDSLKERAINILDITNDYIALDFGLSASADKTENFIKYSAISEGIYILTKKELVHVDAAPETDGYMIAGILLVFKDEMKHALQEICLSNELITSNSGTGHVDDYVNIQYRHWQNYNSPQVSERNNWSSWQNYISTLFFAGQVADKCISGANLEDNAITSTKINNESIEPRHLTVPLYTEIAKIAQLEDVVNDYNNKGLLSFKGLAGSDANKSLASGIYPNISVNVPVAGESFLVQSLRTTTAVHNQYYSTQIAIGTSANVLGKVYIRKNSQKSGSYTFGDWIELTTSLISNDKDAEINTGIKTGNVQSLLSISNNNISLAVGNVKNLYGISVAKGGVSFRTPKSVNLIDIYKAKSLGILNNYDSRYTHTVFKKAIRIKSNTDRGNRNLYILKRFRVAGFSPNKKYALYLDGKLLTGQDIFISHRHPHEGFRWDGNCFIRECKNTPDNNYSIMEIPFNNTHPFGYFVDHVSTTGEVTEVYIAKTTLTDMVTPEGYGIFNDDIVYTGNNFSVPLSVLKDIVLDCDPDKAKKNIYRNKKIAVYGLRISWSSPQKGYTAGKYVKKSRWSKMYWGKNIIRVVFYNRGIPIKNYILKYNGDRNRNRYEQTPKVIG